MTPEQFCQWLRGRADLLPDQLPSAEEWLAIREKLAGVMPGLPSAPTYIPAPTYFPQPAYVPPPSYITTTEIIC